MDPRHSYTFLEPKFIKGEKYLILVRIIQNIHTEDERSCWGKIGQPGHSMNQRCGSELNDMC